MLTVPNRTRGDNKLVQKAAGHGRGSNARTKAGGCEDHLQSELSLNWSREPLDTLIGPNQADSHSAQISGGGHL